jgi:hypothetical protein
MGFREDPRGSLPHELPPVSRTGLAQLPVATSAAELAANPPTAASRAASGTCSTGLAARPPTPRDPTRRRCRHRDQQPAARRLGHRNHPERELAMAIAERHRTPTTKEEHQ